MSRFGSFREFYPYYLSEHANVACRRWHFVGSWLALGFAVTAAATLQPLWLLASLVSGYACAWIGHFFHEHNRPATFKYPFYSFAGDWVMFTDILRGRVSLRR